MEMTLKNVLNVQIEEIEAWIWKRSIHLARTAFAVVVGLVFF
jgi:hypothetical protein